MPFFDVPNATRAVADDRVFLPDATDADWRTLLRCVGTERFAVGQRLVEAGDPSDDFFILAEGTVAVQIRTTFGVKTLATLDAGSVFGEIAFLDGGTRTADVCAVTAGTVLRVTKAAFLSLQISDPQLAGRIALDLGRLCALRLRSTLNRKWNNADGV